MGGWIDRWFDNRTNECFSEWSTIEINYCQTGNYTGSCWRDEEDDDDDDDDDNDDEHGNDVVVGDDNDDDDEEHDDGNDGTPTVLFSLLRSDPSRP